MDGQWGIPLMATARTTCHITSYHVTGYRFVLHSLSLSHASLTNVTVSTEVQYNPALYEKSHELHKKWIGTQANATMLK